MKSSNQKGIALPSVLYAVLILSIFIIATLPMIIKESKQTVTSQNVVSADYAAQAGIKIGIRQALDYLGDDTKVLSNFKIVNKSINLGSSGKTVLLNGDYILGNNTESNPERLELTASSKINGAASNARVWLILDTRFIPGYQPPDVIGLIRSANKNPNKNIYSTQWPNHHEWIIGKDENQRDYGRPYNGNGYNYILFDDRLDPEFRFDYTLEYTKTTGSGGAGVLYGAREGDTAENFYSYAAKFNHDMGAFSVTKFTGGDKNQQEFYSTNPDDMDQNSRKGWGYMIQPNGTGTGIKKTEKDQSGNEYEIEIKPDPLGNYVGKCSITFPQLKEEMQKYYKREWDRLKKAGKPTKLPDGRDIPPPTDDPNDIDHEFITPKDGEEQEYMITVEVKYEEVDVQPGKVIWKKNPNGTTYFDPNNRNLPIIDHWEKTGLPYKERRAYHVISIDGNPILHFYDFSDVYTMENYKTSSNPSQPPPLFIQRGSQCKMNLGTTHVRTGLRVANVQTSKIKFYNTPDLGYGQRLREDKGIVWKR